MADGNRALLGSVLLFFLSVGIMGTAIYEFIIKPEAAALAAAEAAVEAAAADPGLPHRTAATPPDEERGSPTTPRVTALASSAEATIAGLGAVDQNLNQGPA
ncbi:uncharacterized protein LOC113206504 [Frankliniella occidentalis]|uniref:Uncharacterized protein LOC113206504 n=1 Tax=Frankliniella occidentalis TaxID=133901 RepID=A0A6J1SBV2_FRAOC|nr:uncharacterized protein LOC113206504 [Frankliniella occidentalis]XP_026278595.1 uncharacterized protein LOC113206504 [Frankliniella occidentalis]XP_052127668.1 uncharacterized protein LOC113206504 [Frankliniella occidentalis]